MTAIEVWAEIAKTYTIHVETLAVTEKILGITDVKNTEMPQKYIVLDGEVKDMFVPSEDITDGVPVSLYKPSTAPSIPAIVVFFHGGGLIIGNRETYDSCLKMMSAQSGAIVVSVEYRLLPCPEDQYAPFKDSIAVASWVLTNKESVGGCADSKVGVGGDSSGAQIACIVSNKVREIEFQILTNPVTDLRCNLPSFEEFRDIPVFNTSHLEVILQSMGFPVSEVVDDPHFNPSAIQDMGLSPPTLVIPAELDPLRDSGLAYVKTLRTAGIDVEEFMVQGVPHGFFLLVDQFPTTSELARARIAKFLQKFQ